MYYAKVTYEFERPIPSGMEVVTKWRIMKSINPININDVNWFLLTIPDKKAKLIEWVKINMDDTTRLYVTWTDQMNFNPQYDTDITFSGLEIDFPNSLAKTAYAVEEILRVVYDTWTRMILAWSVVGGPIVVESKS